LTQYVAKKELFDRGGHLVQFDPVQQVEYEYNAKAPFRCTTVNVVWGPEKNICAAKRNNLILNKLCGGGGVYSKYEYNAL
jgi:hypothetical protein